MRYILSAVSAQGSEEGFLNGVIEAAQTLHEHGFPFAHINLVILVIAIVIIVDRSIHLSKLYKVSHVDFMAQIRQLIESKKTDKALTLSEKEDVPLLLMTRAALKEIPYGEDAVVAGIEESLTHSIRSLEKRTSMLWPLANIATLIGLIGTISGLIRAFAALGTVTGADRSTLLSNGISEAMYNTFLGLLIAVICMVAHLILNTSTKNNKRDLEEAAAKLETTLLVHRPRD